MQTPRPLSPGELLAKSLTEGNPLAANELQRALEAQHPEAAPYITVTGSDKHKLRRQVERDIERLDELSKEKRQ